MHWLDETIWTLPARTAFVGEGVITLLVRPFVALFMGPLTPRAVREPRRVSGAVASDYRPAWWEERLLHANFVSSMN